MSQPTDASADQRFSVLLVCMGNICRSPMAEIVLRQQLDEAGLSDVTEVDSAGTGGWHVGDPADSRARAVLTSRGYPPTHRARQFDPSWFEQRDLIVALDKENQRDLRRLAAGRDVEPAIVLLGEFDEQGQSTEVNDPYYGSAAGFNEVLDQIERCCAGLVAHIQRHIAE